MQTQSNSSTLWHSSSALLVGAEQVVQITVVSRLDLISVDQSLASGDITSWKSPGPRSRRIAAAIGPQCR